MKVKIYYRSPVVWNIILFIFSSFMFLYFQDISLNETSVTDKISFKIFFSKMNFVGIYCLITAYFFFKVKTYAKNLFLLLVLITSGFTIYNLTLDFSKIVLVILFFYLLISYYFYQFFQEDVEESYYNSGISSQDLFEPMLYKIECRVKTKTGVEYKGYLTNWSEGGCFIYLKDVNVKELAGKVLLEVHYEGHQFSESAVLAALGKDTNGAGFRFVSAPKSAKNNRLGWKDFYGIIEEMGFQAGLLR